MYLRMLTSIFIKLLSISSLGLVGATVLPFSQKPFPPLSPSTNPPTYSFHPYVFLNGQPVDPATTPQVNVGDQNRVIFAARVEDSLGNVVCNQPLTSPSGLLGDPGDILFSSSNYQLRSGRITPNPYLLQNPFDFVGWYAGVVNIAMYGTACAQYHPDQWFIKTEIQFHAATAPVFGLGTDTKCATAAEIDEDNYLSWGNTDNNPCLITWQIKNDLLRPASFGAVQYMLVSKFYIILDDGREYILESGYDIPLLDSYDEGRFVREEVEVDGGGESDILSFGDSPGMPLGNGCWRSPNGKGSYISAGFRTVFRAFVLQDWDSDGTTGIWQTPIGGAGTVLEWENTARANLVGGVWNVDGQRSVVVQPHVVPGVPEAYAPEWRGWGDDPARNRGDVADDGCYELEFDP